MGGPRASALRAPAAGTTRLRCRGLLRVPPKTGTAPAKGGIDETAADWLIRAQSAPDDPQLRAELAEWLAADPAHAAAYRSAQRMWGLAGMLPPDAAAPARAAPARPRPRWGRRFAAAAAVLVVAALLTLFLPGLLLRLEADHRTGTGEVSRVTLPDGTAVHLDAGSAIALAYDPRRRRVRLLAGEAYFEVAREPNRPFQVEADEVRAVATGTAYAVAMTADSVAVTVREGGVEVIPTERSRQRIRMAAGERLSVARAGGTATKGTVAPADIASWRERRLAVNDLSVAEVLAQLERYRPGRIVLRDAALGARRITGSFDLADPLEAVRAIVRAQNGTLTEVTPYLLIVSGP